MCILNNNKILKLYVQSFKVFNEKNSVNFLSYKVFKVVWKKKTSTNTGISKHKNKLAKNGPIFTISNASWIKKIKWGQFHKELSKYGY